MAWPSSLKLSTTAAAVVILASACLFGGDEDEGSSDHGSRSTLDRTAVTAGNPPPSTATPNSIATPESSAAVVTVVYSRPFIWPANGPVTSVMGPDHPAGIDIGLDAGGSLTIRAAAGGTVSHAGGSEDEALGLSIVIDHGNGVSTTYGHLSELKVAPGDQVIIGEEIGTGGSTGISDGDHLHFEVRKDGQTVDPQHVLPNGIPETILQEVDCATSRLVLPVGSQAQIDLSSLLRQDEQVVEASGLALAGGPALQGAVESLTVVRLGTAIDFDGPDREEDYRLEFTIDSPTGNRSLSCNVAIQHRSIPTTFYVRAEPGSDGDEEPDQAEAEPTPLPLPTSSIEPHYSPPAFSNPAAQPPEYTAPANQSPGAQEPASDPLGGSMQ